MRLEKGLIEHCAPTLAGIKSASLFSYFYNEKKTAIRELEEINILLNNKGVYVEALQWRKDAVLVYVYRASHLQKELQQPGVRELLAQYGYENGDIDSCLAHLKKRLRQQSGFPHEIGAFLGYPLEDVKGFIENAGANCKCYGLWKVYSNEGEAIRLFNKLKKCTNVYLRVFAEGRSLTQMTVCA